MNPRNASALRTCLDRAEGYCGLGMWESAWNALDELPEELRAHPDVISRRLDVLIGLAHWEKASILGASLAKIMPGRADVWFRVACVQARLGDLGAAKEAIRRCIHIDRGWRLRVLDEPALDGLW